MTTAIINVVVVILLSLTSFSAHADSRQLEGHWPLLVISPPEVQLLNIHLDKDRRTSR